MSKLDSSIAVEIRRLAKKKNAVILSHNYQPGEVQNIADYLGDSLELSRQAAKTSADTIVFCGVHFMAETASILSPDKIVLIPDKKAGCPMANMISAERLHSLRAKHPKATVVSYVNSTAEVKAESDICCTSANAVRVVKSREEKDIIFVPDKYLAAYVAGFVEKEIIPWNGFCPTHVKILPEHVTRQKELHPEAEVIVHPECTPPVIELADEVLSTGGMCKHAKKSAFSEMIVGTEIGLLYRLRKENPKKKFYPASDKAICPNMKKISLDKILWALQDMKPEVKVPEEIRVQAKKALDRMLAVS
ncbi:MAG: quinolinate synthase NadA [Candidatus Bathyarchaeota archaeon]|nr:MAG: quinolinate synthase NadA [Candidatus Bathyarchaeota archaeon]